MNRALSTFGVTDSQDILRTQVHACPWISPLYNRTTGSGTLSDADYGDITVSSSGAVWTIDNAAVTEAKIGLSDNTTNNSSTSNHGFLKKLSNTATQYMDGSGNWSVPAGTGETTTDQAYARRAPWYLPFTLLTDDDEFDDASFTGWTAVNSGSHTVVVTEANDVVSLAHPGSDAAGELHAWMKAKTINTNDYVEAWFHWLGRSMNSPSFGVIMANGATYGAGTQVFWEIFYTGATPSFANAVHTNYSTAGSSTSYGTIPGYAAGVGLRLQYLGSNNWKGFFSIDGVSWTDLTGSFSRTMTPTHAGFFISTWGGALQANCTVRYCRFSS